MKNPDTAPAPAAVFVDDAPGPADVTPDSGPAPSVSPGPLDNLTLDITAEVYGIYAEIHRDKDIGADTSTPIPPVDTLHGTVRHTLNEVAIKLRKATGLRGNLGEILSRLVADAAFFRRYLERATPPYRHDERRYEAKGLRADVLIRFGTLPPDTATVLGHARVMTKRRGTFTPFDDMSPDLRARWVRAARVDLAEVTPALIEALARAMFRATIGPKDPHPEVWPGWLFEAEETLRLPVEFWPPKQVDQRVAGLRALLTEGATATAAGPTTAAQARDMKVDTATTAETTAATTLRTEGNTP